MDPFVSRDGVWSELLKKYEPRDEAHIDGKKDDIKWFCLNDHHDFRVSTEPLNGAPQFTIAVTRPPGLLLPRRQGTKQYVITATAYEGTGIITNFNYNTSLLGKEALKPSPSTVMKEIVTLLSEVFDVGVIKLQDVAKLAILKTSSEDECSEEVTYVPDKAQRIVAGEQPSVYDRMGFRAYMGSSCARSAYDNARTKLTECTRSMLISDWHALTKSRHAVDSLTFGVIECLCKLFHAITGDVSKLPKDLVYIPGQAVDPSQPTSQREYIPLDDRALHGLCREYGAILAFEDNIKKNVSLDVQELINTTMPKHFPYTPDRFPKYLCGRFGIKLPPGAGITCGNFDKGFMVVFTDNPPLLICADISQKCKDTGIVLPEGDDSVVCTLEEKVVIFDEVRFVDFGVVCFEVRFTSEVGEISIYTFYRKDGKFMYDYRLGPRKKMRIA